MEEHVNRLIDQYKLNPHPEGGYYKEVYKSGHSVESSTAGKPRSTVTHIYFLLVKNQISRFHKVVHDEIWNFYEGDPIRLIKYDGVNIKEDLIGCRGGHYAAIIKGGVYQAAVSTGNYSFAGCTVAPGFEFEDFSLLKDHDKIRKSIMNNYPQYQQYI
jgi:predicted cupin superfamily sugar epimerase